MNQIFSVMKRELHVYFTTPIAYIFLIAFVFMSGLFTFYFGMLFERNQADLGPFFQFHPWLYLFFIPALSMRLWSEERSSGTIELLLTLPVTPTEAVIGKFLATWLFTWISLLWTFPIWVTVNYLGNPDNGMIITGYIGSLVMASTFIAISACMSACSRNQVVAFVLAASVCLLFLLGGHPLVRDFLEGWAPRALLDMMSTMSFITRFRNFSQGLIDLRDLLFFSSLTIFWLYLNTLVLNEVRARQ